MDEKLKAAVDALLELKALRIDDPQAQRIVQKALTKIWCDYYRHTHQNSYINQHPALSARMLG